MPEFDPNDELIFTDPTPAPASPLLAWKILIVDDELAVHQATQLALKRLVLLERRLEFINAYSGQEALHRLREHPDIALVLLDVVMETEYAGLETIKHIRETLVNPLVRVVLCTGQPGQAPEKKVIIDYDINDYRTKTELTNERLLTTVMTALRAYRDLIRMETLRTELLTLTKNLEAQVETRTQELLLAKQAAEQANYAKSNFLARMSHELRTPLNAIIGYAELIAEDMQDLNIPTTESDAQKICSTAIVLLQQLNDILDMSKVEAGKMELHIETFPIMSLVEEVLALMMPLAKKNANSLKLDSISKLGFMCSDRGKLRQILLNLLGNALKFTKEGEVTLAVTLTTLSGNPGIQFVVADTGIGMTDAVQAKLFQNFCQANAATTTHYGGTGLGLAISWSLCTLLGGTIQVKSHPGIGSIFTVHLPTRLSEQTP